MLRIAAVIAVVAAFSASTAMSRVGASGPGALPLRTGLVRADPAASAARQTGATLLRIQVDWGAVAPAAAPASGFEAANPADPAYDWSAVDGAVNAAVSSGFAPILNVIGAPDWVQSRKPAQYYGPYAPDPAQLAKFATAIATRYSGSFQGLPRVRDWLVWNEPNLVYYLQPQYVGGKPFAPSWYRRLVNAFADAVHRVHADNLVVAGATAPFTTFNGKSKDPLSMAPLAFMRSFFCLNRALRPTCHARVRIDAWSHHPYTSGGPTHHAVRPDDVSLGDLPKMRAVLDAAWRTHEISAARRPQFWVTEFSWDTRPPDPDGVPIRLQARWVAEALHVMWQNGISVVTWFSLYDEPMATSRYQSGLFFAPDGAGDAKPKPALTAFRFPFVAYAHGSSLSVWGRTPTSSGGLVTVEQAKGGTWVKLAALRAASTGVFAGSVRARGGGLVRARFGSEASLPFSLHVPPDHFYNPFGSAS